MTTKHLFFTFSTESGASHHILDIDDSRDVMEQAREMLGEYEVILSAEDAFYAGQYINTEIAAFGKGAKRADIR